MRTGRRAPLARPYQRRRWESNPLNTADHRCPCPGSRRAVWLQRLSLFTAGHSRPAARNQSVLARSRTWPSTFAGSRANPPHSEDVFLFSAPPRSRTRAPPRSGGQPGCKPSVFPLDQRPVSTERSVPELNRIFLLTEEVCCQNTYRPFFTTVIPDGIEPSLSWLSPRRRCRWATGSSVTEVGLRTHKRFSTATCFQDRLLIRPDDFRGQAAEAGIEPT